MDFQNAFPPLIYETEEGKYEAYGPPIPVKLNDDPITNEDIVKLGAYPDNVTLSLAKERDRSRKQLHEVTQEMGRKLHEITEQLKQEKTFSQEQFRLAQMWQGRYHATQATQPQNAGNNNVQEDTASDTMELPNGDVPEH